MSSSTEKKCFKCGVTQPRANFYKHSQMADGLLGKCKTCTKNDVSTHREDNIDKVRAYDRDRGKNKDRIRNSVEHTRKWRNEDSRMARCHSIVARAIRNGEIVKQNCIVCGSENSLAHHESYNKPLDVTFYCQIHHKARHKEMAIMGIDPLESPPEDSIDIKG